MSNSRPSLPRPIALLLDCARQGNIASAADTGLRALEVAAAPVVIGAAGASAVIGWPIYAALAAGLLGIGVWNALDDRKDKARIKDTANALKKLADDKGSLTNAAAYMLKQERESKRPLEVPYALADNAAVALYETLTARHDNLANTLAKHEGFYVSLGSYLDEHFDDFKHEFKLAQKDRDELRGMLQSIASTVQANLSVSEATLSVSETTLCISQDSNDTVKRIEQFLLAQRQANPNATLVLSDEDKALLDQAKSHGDLKSRAAASVLRPDAETDDLLRQLRDRHDTEAFELDMLEGKRWYFAGEYDKAVEPFKKAIMRRPDDIEARNYAAIAHTFARLGDIAAHRLRAIEIAEGTLKLVSEFSTEWAVTQTNLGIAWRNLPTGDLFSNLAKAIKCCESALTVHTRCEYPNEWAATHNNLGVVWFYLQTDEAASNLTKAIDCYKLALEVRTRSAHPACWAMTQTNLGNAWSFLPTGDRASNFKMAIDCYESALLVYTHPAYPAEWAVTQNNLGLTWQRLPTGDRGSNLKNAIVCFETALEARTRSAHPAEWAMMQHNLGAALADLAAQPGQDCCQLLRRAIAAGKGALTVRTPEAFPHDHTNTLHNLNIDRRAYEAAGCAADIPFDDIPPAQ